MAQFDFTTADGPIVGTKSFPNTRADINSALLALISNSSGDAEPTGTQANQFWYETDTNILKIRNEANSGWINVLTLDESMTVSASELNLLDDLTRGSILYGNASGATARLTAGGAATVLTSDGTDISWAAASSGGAYNLLQTVTANDSATVSVGSSSLLTATYSTYEIHVTGLIPATDNATLRGRVLIGGSIISASNYNYWVFNVVSNSTAVYAQRAESVTFFQAADSMNNPSSGATNFVLRFYNPASTTLLKTWDYSGSSKDNNLTRIRLISGAAGYCNGTSSEETAALTGFNFFASSGNITSGVFKLYGIT